VPPSKASFALCMAIVKCFLSKSTNIESSDMIYAYGSEATVDDVEAAVLEKNRDENPVNEIHFAGVHRKIREKGEHRDMGDVS
jgi:hypothetical protein